MERALLVVGLVAREVQIQARGQHALGAEARVHLRQLPERAQHQARPGQQHERDRDLRDDQQVAQRAAGRRREPWCAPALPAAIPSGCAAARARGSGRGRCRRRATRRARRAAPARSRPISVARGVKRSAKCTSILWPAAATTRPRAPPVSASSTLSVSSCRVSRPRPGPERRAQRQLLLAARSAARASGWRRWRRRAAEPGRPSRRA